MIFPLAGKWNFLGGKIHLPCGKKLRMFFRQVCLRIKFEQVLNLIAEPDIVFNRKVTESSFVIDIKWLFLQNL